MSRCITTMWSVLLSGEGVKQRPNPPDPPCSLARRRLSLPLCKGVPAAATSPPPAALTPPPPVSSASPPSSSTAGPTSSPTRSTTSPPSPISLSPSRTPMEVPFEAPASPLCRRSMRRPSHRISPPLPVALPTTPPPCCHRQIHHLPSPVTTVPPHSPRRLRPAPPANTSAVSATRTAPWPLRSPPDDATVCDPSLVHIAITLDVGYLRGSIAAVHSILQHGLCPENVFFSVLQHALCPENVFFHLLISENSLETLVRSAFPQLRFKGYYFDPERVRGLISTLSGSTPSPDMPVPPHGSPPSPAAVFLPNVVAGRAARRPCLSSLALVREEDGEGTNVRFTVADFNNARFPKQHDFYSARFLEQ